MKNRRASTDPIVVVILMGLVIFISAAFNSCTSKSWNNGTCPECGVRYELRGATRQVKIYVCPECGKEVERM